MTYLLDTDTCIALLKARPEALAWLEAQRPDQIVVSTISQAELFYGAHKSAKSQENLAVFEAFLAPLRVQPFDTLSARVYGLIRTDLERRGTPIGPNDLKIAAVAVAHGLILVTHNVREFSRVAGLRWIDILDPEE